MSEMEIDNRLPESIEPRMWALENRSINDAVKTMARVRKELFEHRLTNYNAIGPSQNRSINDAVKTMARVRKELFEHRLTNYNAIGSSQNRSINDAVKTMARVRKELFEHRLTDYGTVRSSQNRSINDDLNEKVEKPFTRTERKWLKKKMKKHLNLKKSEKEQTIRNEILKSVGLRIVKNLMDFIQSIF